MSQRFLIHVHGECLARESARSTLTISLLRTLSEAAEIRAQRQFIFGNTGRVVARGVGTNVFRGENGDINLDVQVQIEEAVMVDYHPKAHRIPKAFWDRKQSGIPKGDPANQSPWGLSPASVNKMDPGNL